MPVVWNPGRVAALAALDLALALAPVGLLPLDGGQASAFASGESDGTDDLVKRFAAWAGAWIAGGMVLGYVRPLVLCPCHALSIEDLLHHVTNGLLGFVLAVCGLSAAVGGVLHSGALNAAMPALLWTSEPEPPDTAEPWLLPGLCEMHRASVATSVLLMVGAHTAVPLTAATKSQSDALRRVVSESSGTPDSPPVRLMCASTGAAAEPRRAAGGDGAGRCARSRRWRCGDSLASEPPHPDPSCPSAVLTLWVLAGLGDVPEGAEEEVLATGLEVWQLRTLALGFVWGKAAGLTLSVSAGNGPQRRPLAS